MATGNSDAAVWRAAALDVRGPGSRNGGRWRTGEPDDAFATGDRGELWIEGNALFFSGRSGAWSVPLNWLGTPEAGLSGAIEIPLRTADRRHSLTLRLEDAADEQPLTDAIRRSRVQEPDARDRRALFDLLALLRPELQLIEAAATALAGVDVDQEHLNHHAEKLLAAAARLRSTWLPYWGDPATRLRDATLGALTGAGEATRPAAGDAATERNEQATRRFRNVCEDLHDWCGLPESLDTLPAPRRPIYATEPPSSVPVPSAAPAESTGQQSGDSRPINSGAVPHVNGPAAGAAEPATTTPPSSLWMPPTPPAPTASMPDADEDITVIAAAPGQHLASSDSPPAESPAWTAAPSQSVVREEPVEEDPTLLVNTPAVRDTALASPPLANEITAGASSAETLAQTPVVTGPGRPGSGGMTMLYRRSGSGPGGHVARKELQKTALETPGAAATFQRLGDRFATVQHPNFVRIIDSGADAEGVSHFDMEFVEGEGSHARLRRGPLPLDQALDVIDQLAGAVDAVHQAGLVHGDIRPMNVLLEPGGRAVLLEPSVASDYLLEQRRGTIYGELSYLTPERVRGDPGEARGDIYAFGSLAFALLTGHAPFEGEANDIFTGHAEGTPPPLDSVIAAPRAAADAIARSLSKRPSDRQPTAAELATTLRRAFADAPQQPAAAPSVNLSPTPAQEIALPQAPAEPAAGGLRPANEPATVPPSLSAPGPLGRGAPSPLGRVTPQPPRNLPDDPGETVIEPR